MENNLATKGKRFLNYILDFIFYLVFAFVLGIVTAIIGLGATVQAINDILLGFIIMIVYYVFLEAIFGKTIAKFITRTKVVTRDGQKPNLKVILVRTLCRFIPFEAFSFLGDKPIGWHDSISKTIVVNDQ